MSEKVYLFKRKGSKITHAVITKHKSLGFFELDRTFGGGLFIVCTGKEGEGAGILSEVPMSTGHVTCKSCVKKMKTKGIRITKPLKKESWPPEHLRKLDRPRILGIPG